VAQHHLPPPKAQEGIEADPLKYDLQKQIFLADKEKMFYTYILRCTDTKRKRRKFYVGATENLEKRIINHKSKSIKTTKSFDKIELVYYEVCFNKTDAIRRELKLKTGFGRGYIKRRIESYLKSLRD